MDIPTVSRSAPSSILQATEMVSSQVPQAGSRRSQLKRLQWLHTAVFSTMDVKKEKGLSLGNNLSPFLCVIKIFDGTSSHLKVKRPHLSFDYH